MIRALLLAASFAIALAAPAAAQERDPFQPLVSADTSGTTTTAGDPSDPEAQPMPEPDAEAVPKTGADTQQLAGLAVALIGIGGATLVATAQRRRRIPQRAGSVA